MVATSDFSGLTSAACALASAEASAATVSLARGMSRLRLEQVEADGAGLGALARPLWRPPERVPQTRLWPPMVHGSSLMRGRISTNCAQRAIEKIDDFGFVLPEWPLIHLR